MNAWNSAEFLEEAIDSVLSQSMPDWEIVLWDNGSTDETVDVARRKGDSRIKIHVDSTKKSLYQSRINAIAHAAGQYVGFLDCDDTWMPHKLEVQTQFLEEASVDAVASDYWVEVSSSRSPNRRKISRCYRDDFVDLGEVVSRYKVGLLTLLARAEPLRRSLPANAPDWAMIEDLDMVVRVVGNELLGVIHEPLATYRVHSSNASRDLSRMIEERQQWRDFLRSTSQLDDYALATSMHAFENETLRIQVIDALRRGDRGEVLELAGRLPLAPARVKAMALQCLPKSMWGRALQYFARY